MIGLSGDQPSTSFHLLINTDMINEEMPRISPNVQLRTRSSEEEVCVCVCVCVCVWCVCVYVYTCARVFAPAIKHLTVQQTIQLK